MFTTFTITVISESMKSMEKLSGKRVMEKWWNFTPIVIYVLCYEKKKKKKKKKIKKNKKNKKEKKNCEFLKKEV